MKNKSDDLIFNRKNSSGMEEKWYLTVFLFLTNWIF